MFGDSVLVAKVSAINVMKKILSFLMMCRYRW